MSEPWFDANHYAWIPGTVFGVVAGLYGSCAGVLAPRGRAKGPILGAAWLLLACAVALLALALVAWFDGQPYGVWYGLGLPGVIGLIVVGSLMPTISGRYREAERRRLEAQDLSL
jgi:hypothetical protein